MLYEQSLSNPKELQTLKQFLAFIENRFQSLEALGIKADNLKRQGAAKTLTSVVSTGQNKNNLCTSCKGYHPLFSCKEFLKMTPSNRLNFVRRHDLCINCLKPGHNASKCSLRGCTKCTRKHNTLVHLEISNKSERPEGSEIKGAHNSTATTNTSLTSDNSNEKSLILTALQKRNQRSYVLLGTAIVKLVTNEGQSLECRALLDSGSQINLITERVVKKLRLSSNPASMFIQGIGKGKMQAQERINVQLQSRLNGFKTQLEAFVLPTIISPQPTQHLDISTWPIPKNLKLADQNFNCPDRIDVLLGAEFYHQLFSVGQIRLADDLPTLQNTVFGWILIGKIDRIPSVFAACGICSEDEEETSKLIERFWRLEEIEPTETRFTTAEKRCEAHFAQNVKRDENGRFVVSLPFAGDPKTLGQSSQTAYNRFLALERRFAKNNDLKQQYIEFMAEYLKLGHMVEIDMNNVPSPHYFIPHHCVFKPDSSTTKLRVVFDASTKTSSGYALNDVLYTGPTVQSELFSILLRFRVPRFVFTADIQKMYRQILIQPSDRNYQLIFWRSDPEEALKCYQLCTVTYGTRSAPYLATKCLQKLAQENMNKYPLGAQVLKTDFYVDDGITGSNSLSTTIEMQKQLTTILQKAGFKLRKWCANHPQLLQGISPEDQEIDLDFKNNTVEKIKTLGLTWLPKSDKFRVRASWNSGTHVTKRIVSSDLARLFDPLGIMAPVVVTAKIFIQQLWQLKLNWDEALPLELHTKWLKFRSSLTVLDKIQFSRHIFSHDIPKAVQIHAFSDASEKAYGAAIYIRSTNKEGRIVVRLLCAKSRVAPPQKQTVPRLELCAAVLSSQLVARVKKDLKFEDVPTHFWTDSEIVLGWIHSSSLPPPIFVANRVAAIQELSLAQQWRHVRSKENPADILSRGLSPEKLGSCNLWFYGPLFLHGRETIWPAPYAKKPNADDHQEGNRMETIHTASVTANNFEDIVYKINHGNSFRKLQRIIAYVRRFLIHSRYPMRPRQDQISLTPGELDGALYVIVKAMQESDFKEEIKQLKKYKEVDKGSSISGLAPFLDEREIIRVGGRLKASALSYDAKHQMLIPYADQLTKLLMNDIHKENLHCGPQTLLSHTRQRFWPMKGKSIARSVVQHCVRCARAKPRLLSQMMGNLPSTRVQPARPFVNSGVDFCGPLWVHYKIRGKKPQKAYIAVFCCFATKAVHLELVSDLSTEAFIGSLKRFMGRRGHCQNLYCDNATNFVGARNQLEELTKSIYSDKSQENIAKTCSNKGINFQFIPPRAPHFGGLWEAAVKSAKHLLLRTISSASLTYEELETVIVEAEAVLNSRPITPLSADPNDLTALTPGHFLIGEPLTAHLDSRLQPLKASLLARWQLVTHLKDEFWRRWSLEYLNELQYRYKWKEQCQNIKPGTMVVVKDDNLPVMKWPLGRVVQIYRGNDGLVRVVDVRTANGVLHRPIHKLSPLPVEENQPIEEDIVDHISKRDEMAAQGVKSRVEPSTSQTTRDDVPKKRMKISRGSLITTLLLACMMLPTIQGNPITITRFSPNPGIHFENLGMINLITTEWKLVIYYDLEPYWTEVAALSNGTLALQHLCQQIRQKTICTELVSQFKHIENELKLDNSLFSTRRVKRGAFNVVGNVARSLFGVLDSEYAEEMSRTIDSIKENEDHLVRLLRNQTSIVDSTVNIIKRDQVETEKKFKSLEDQISQIITRINDTGEETYQLKMYQLLTSLSIQMTIVASNLQRIQSSIIDALTDTHHGRLSPILLSPQQLREEIVTIKTHLPTSMHLPMNQEDILQLYKLMSAEAGIANNHVIFEIKLPLVDQIKFDVFRVIPIPTFINNTFVAITPSTSFLAINSHRDNYFPMAEGELASCTLLKGGTYLCPNSHPIYHNGAKMCSCEVNLFNNITQGDCELKKVEGSPIWIQLTHKNQWVYAVQGPTRMNTVCGKEIFQIILEGSGLLDLQSECVIKHDLITLQGHHLFPSTMSTSYTRLGGLSEITKPERIMPVLLEETNQYQPQLKELVALQNLISAQEVMELPNQIQAHNIHHFTTGYLALFLSCIIILYLVWRFKADLLNCKKKPKPAPRRSREVFTVDV